MRTMYDSTSAYGIPVSAAMVAGYINGRWAWAPGEWNRFPHAELVEITISAGLNAGDVLDVENGDATPQQTEAWIAARKSAGLERPTIYCSRDTIPAVRTGTGRWVLGRDYDIWCADWTKVEHQVTAPGPGPAAACAAVQYASHGAFDLSAVYDPAWPHRSAAPPAPPAPTKAEALSAYQVLGKYLNS